MLFAFILAVVLLGQPGPYVPPPAPTPQAVAPSPYAGYAQTGGAAALGAGVTGAIGWLLKGREIRAGSDAWFREYGATILKEQRAEDRQELADLKKKVETLEARLVDRDKRVADLEGELRDVRSKLADSLADRERLERKDTDQQREIESLRAQVAVLRGEVRDGNGHDK